MAASNVGAQTYLNAAVSETKVVPLVGSFLIFNITCFNADTSDPVYVQFFDALTANVTVGTTVPTWVAPLPPNGGIDTGLAMPKAFRNGVVVAATATATGAGAPATAALVEFDYVSG